MAHEAYEKIKDQGVLCNLLTGQERIEIKNAKHIACTVEMADLTTNYDCAIIDEIQMIDRYLLPTFHWIDFM